MGDVMYKIWASQQALGHVRDDHPLTRLRGVCPECGNRTLHLYPFLKGRPGYEVFLWCECGLGDFCDEDDWKVRAARPFDPSMSTSGWVRDLARRGKKCPVCGKPLEVMDAPNPNEATGRCPSCGHFEHIYASTHVSPRTSRNASAKGKGVLLQFRPRDGAE